MIQGTTKIFPGESIGILSLNGRIILGVRTGILERMARAIPDKDLIEELERQTFQGVPGIVPGISWWSGSVVIGSIGGFKLLGAMNTGTRDQVLAVITDGKL